MCSTRKKKTMNFEAATFSTAFSWLIFECLATYTTLRLQIKWSTLCELCFSSVHLIVIISFVLLYANVLSPCQRPDGRHRTQCRVGIASVCARFMCESSVYLRFRSTCNRLPSHSRVSLSTSFFCHRVGTMDVVRIGFPFISTSKVNN